MTGINHVLAGAVIGATISNPILALPIALASHLVLDVTPHFGWKDHTSKFFLGVLITDFILVMTVFGFLLIRQPANWPIIAASAFIAAIPDALWVKYWVADFRGLPKPPFTKLTKFLKDIQWGEFKWGLAVEIPVALFLATTMTSLI
jgi:hypothetical protein